MTTIARGMTLRNPFSGERFTFTGSFDDPEVARMEVRLDPGGSAAADALVHVHPRAEERFIVRSGRIHILLDGVIHELGPGEQLAVPPNRPHTFANPGGDPAEMTVELRPAQDFLRFFANVAVTARRHPDWYSKKGKPAFLLIALTLHVYRDHFYPAGPPLALQRALFAALARVARLRGYRVEVPPRPRPAAVASRVTAR